MPPPSFRFGSGRVQNLTRLWQLRSGAAALVAPAAAAEGTCWLSQGGRWQVEPRDGSTAPSRSRLPQAGSWNDPSSVTLSRPCPVRTAAVEPLISARRQLNRKWCQSRLLTTRPGLNNPAARMAQNKVELCRKTLKQTNYGYNYQKKFTLLRKLQ